MLGHRRAFRSRDKKQTRVISVSHVITSTGSKDAGSRDRRVGEESKILTVIGGAQAVGNIEVDVRAIGCDAYAGPGHKWRWRRRVRDFFI